MVENVETPSATELHKKLEIIDRSPEELTSNVPVFLVQGWGETPITHEQTIATITGNKRRAIMVKFPRIGKLDRTQEYPAVELNKATNILNAIEKSGASKVDVIAHSEGALASMIAIDLEPEKFRNIVLVDPAGLIDKDTTAKLATRFTYMLLKDGVRLAKGDGSRKEKIKASIEASKYFITNPKRGLEEASVMAKSDIYEMLVNLRKIGVGVSVIHGVNDTVFPMQRVISASGEKGGIETIGFYAVKGDHREISVHPEKYTALAVNALDNLSSRLTT